MAKGLTAKQARFVEEYLLDLNATQASIRAGYSPKTALQQGPRLLGHVGVAAAITKARAARTERTEVSQDWVISRLVENAERSMQAVPVYDSDGDPTGEYRYEGSVANRALELLGKHLGLFVDNVNLRTPDGIRLEVVRRVVPASNRVAAVVGNGANGHP
jgi:phage terminase small subunit